MSAFRRKRLVKTAHEALLWNIGGTYLGRSPKLQPYQASFFTNDRSPHRPLVGGLVTNLRAVPLSNTDDDWLLV